MQRKLGRSLGIYQSWMHKQLQDKETSQAFGWPCRVGVQAGVEWRCPEQLARAVRSAIH